MEELRGSKLKLTTGMDLAHLACWEYDMLSDRFYFDDRFYSLYGTNAEREHGHYMSYEAYAHEFIHPDDVSLVTKERQMNIASNYPGDHARYEHRICRRDGEVRYMIVRLGVIRNASGNAVKAYGVNQDITELKLAEEGLKRASEKLNLLSSITMHDIKNQLVVLSGNLSPPETPCQGAERCQKDRADGEGQ